MKKYLMFGVLILLTAAVTLPVWSSGKAEKTDGQQDCVYAVRNQDEQHVQVLGGKSSHAHRGLARAAVRARSMGSDDSSDKPGDTADPIDVKPKKKK
jgi:hypothetical protein